MDREPGVGVVDRVRGGIVCAAVILTATAYSFHLTSFLLAKQAVLSVALFLMAALAIAGQTPARRGLAAFGPLWVWLGLSAAVHLLVRPAAVPRDALLELTRCAVLLLAAGLSFDVMARPAWRQRVLGAIIASGVVVALLGLLQYAGWARALFPEFAGYSQRAYSVFGNQDLFGGYLAMALALAAYRALVRPRDTGRLALFGDGLILGTLTAGLLVSGCRAAWLAGGAGCGVAAAFALPHALREHRRAVGAVAAFVLAVAAATALFAREATIGRMASVFAAGDAGVGLRLWFWDGALRMVRDHALIGVGPGNYAYWSPRYLGEALWAAGGGLLGRGGAHAFN
ncbi:MAG: O-antigen ligase family protein, partial [Candidatus Hydrogenedentes bacterium]|nr:O-antigen ligase family protein [Candidatus Hydrogenedentota bacterium]